jgi:hypothetical protein
MSRCLSQRSTADSESDPAEFLRGQWKTGLPFLRDTGMTRPFRLAGVSPVSRPPGLQGDFNPLATRTRSRRASAFHPALRLIDVVGMMIWLNPCLGKWWRRRESNDLGC